MGRPKIDLEADIQPVSDFRANTSGMIEQVRETGRPLVLTQRGRGAVVLLDIHAYQSMVDELDELRDVCAGLADVEKGRVVSNEEAKKDLRQRLRR
jgi:antitoxin YefM